jgi:hypothetical protein
MGWSRLAAVLVTLGTVTACSTTPNVEPAPRARQAAAAVRSFRFAAAGDHGANRHTAAMLTKLDASRARFYLALGDLDYDQTPTDAAWCRYVKAHLPTKGARFPFELVTGNHEQDGGPDGRIGHFTKCLPDRMSSVGTYGAQYSFTYPRRNPFAAFVMISPQLTVAGHTYRYGPGTADRRWLVRRIDAARAAGIRWVVVGLHYPCISTGASHGCDSGAAVMNLLLRKHVDLVLTGHNHIYERSKQLRLNGTSCRAIRPEHFNAHCVVDGGADGRYRKGRGTVQVTAGAVHGGELGVNPRDGDVPFFVKENGTSTGFMIYALSPTGLHGRWVGTSGSLRDSFDIVG